MAEVGATTRGPRERVGERPDLRLVQRLSLPPAAERSLHCPTGGVGQGISLIAIVPAHTETWRASARPANLPRKPLELSCATVVPASSL